MNELVQTRRPTIEPRATYLIRVFGEVDACWLDYFSGISIMVSEEPGMWRISTICAPDSDQARLMGILNSLYDYQFPILYLERRTAQKSM